MGLFDLFRKKSSPPPEQDDPPERSVTPIGGTRVVPGASVPKSGPFTPISEDQWDDWDDDARMQWCMQQFEVLAKMYDDAKLKRVTADESLILRAMHEGRPFSLAVDYTTGWLTLTLRFVNRLGHMVLHYDEDKQLHHSDSQQETGGGVWEDDDARDEVTHVFERGVYVEEFEAEARPMIALVDGLPTEVRATAFQALKGRVFNYLTVDANKVYGVVTQDLQQMGDPKAALDGCFGYLMPIAAHFSAGNVDVPPKATVYIRGQPVFPQGMPQRATCGYCSTPYVVADDDPRCPSCGAVNG